MAILQVRDIDEKVYSALKNVAKTQNRSLSQEVIFIIERYLSCPIIFNKNNTKDFLALSGSWDDNRSHEKIVTDIKKQRLKNKRFESKNGLFD